MQRMKANANAPGLTGPSLASGENTEQDRGQNKLTGDSGCIPRKLDVAEAAPTFGCGCADVRLWLRRRSAVVVHVHATGDS
jgi:hypothetical protein